MPERRWRGGPTGEGTAQLVLTSSQRNVVRRLARRLLESMTLRWTSLARFGLADQDAVDVERLVEALACSGILEIAERRDRRGDFHPYLIRVAPGADEQVRRLADDERGADQRAERARRLVAVLEELASQENVLPVPARTLVQRALGNTKVVRVADFRTEIETAFDLPLEALVRDHTTAVLTAGPFSFRYRGLTVNGRASIPWSAITEPVLKDLTDLEVEIDEVLTIENQTPFETLSFRGESEQRLLVFTSGFLGRAERRWMELLVHHPRIRRVRHWGDLDPGGLMIFRSVRDLVERVNPAVEVLPWRMDASLLDHPSAVPLTANDRARLEAYLLTDNTPLVDVARAMLDRGSKLEQEACLLDHRT